jgi:hypothetical protein
VTRTRRLPALLLSAKFSRGGWRRSSSLNQVRRRGPTELGNGKPASRDPAVSHSSTCKARGDRARSPKCRETRCGAPPLFPSPRLPPPPPPATTKRDGVGARARGWRFGRAREGRRRRGVRGSGLAPASPARRAYGVSKVTLPHRPHLWTLRRSSSPGARWAALGVRAAGGRLEEACMPAKAGPAGGVAPGPLA